jgi:D-tyrosyl-tRNA(Tyr) deacylase
MIAMIQRVQQAHVEIEGVVFGSIGRGVLALVGVERYDTDAQAERLLKRILGYRIFPDATGRMSRSLAEIDGGLLLVPQFTLVADTRKGMRASFSAAAPPPIGERLFKKLLVLAMQSHRIVETGRFGADMQIHLVNDGPVTFWLQSSPSRPK